MIRWRIILGMFIIRYIGNYKKIILLNILSKHTINSQKTIDKMIIGIGDYENPIEDDRGLPLVKIFT